MYQKSIKEQCFPAESPYARGKKAGMTIHLSYPLTLNDFNHFNSELSNFHPEPVEGSTSQTQ